MSDRGDRLRAQRIRSSEKKSARMAGRLDTLTAAFMEHEYDREDDSSIERDQASASIPLRAPKMPKRDI